MKKLALLLLCGITLLPSARAQLKADLFDGRPDFSEGEDRGYYVWREGETWHVRWTTMGQTRRFSGSITADQGALTSLKRIDVEAESRLIRPGRAPRTVVGPRGRVRVRGGRAPVVATREQDRIEKDGDNRIVFASRTDGDIDGFVFKVGKRVDSLRFVLEIDGRARVQAVDVGKDNQKVPRVPFTVELE